MLESIGETRPDGIGGGASLTPAGERVVALYREPECTMRSAEREIAGIEKALAGEGGGAAASEGAAPGARPAPPRSR